jgi:hypothetical protein
MKDLTKEELVQIIKESNKDILDELTYADELSMDRINTLDKYEYFVTQAAGFFKEMIETAKSDYEGKVIQDSDLDSIINKTCVRMIDAVNSAQSALAAIGGAGIKEPEQGLTYPGYLEE